MGHNGIRKLFEDRVSLDFKQFLLHSKNYITADFLQQGLAFLTIPIFTFLLSPEDYGYLAVYNSLVSLLTLIIGLNLRSSVVRFYHDENIVRKVFIGNITFAVILISVSLFLLLFVFKNYLSSLLTIPTALFYFAIIVSLFNVFFSTFQGFQQTSKNSKGYSRLVILYSVLLITGSIIWIYFLKDNKYFGRIYTQSVIIAFLGLFGLYRLFNYSKFVLNIGYLKKALSYSVPLLPHSLSGLALAYFDRIIIQQLCNSKDVGLYSLGFNIGMIMQIIVMALNKSWLPIFYDKMNRNDIQSIPNIVKNYSRIVFFVAIALIFFSKEIMIIMTDKSYYEALKIVPIVVLSFMFVFLYTIYANFAFYFKKTILISIFTFIAAFINIVLNYLFIPKFGYISAAFTTLVSFIILFGLHYFNSTYILKIKTNLPLTLFFFETFLVILCLLINYVVFDKINIFLALLIKIAILLLLLYHWFLSKKIKL